ncbi:MAG: Import inner membrane translocase subunit Tim44 [Candidatus Tokpelaia sp. JSC085]|nr:MAG: Import inner membrane translocase subunit Tim44 [Candidatus Tokpelaia sp. JSC085]
MDLNIVTLIFLVLAVLIFIQLRSVLGRRTGNERLPFDPYSKPVKTGVDSSGKTVAASQESRHGNDDFADIDALAPLGSKLNDGLRAISEADPAFSPILFCNGARVAYEKIITAFANGRRSDMENLLSKDVYEDFSQAIDEREACGQSVNFSFIGINKSEIVSADLQQEEAYIGLSLSSEIISSTYDKNGQLVDGDPQKIIEVHDLWTFARDTRTCDPNWKLVATGNEE